MLMLLDRTHRKVCPFHWYQLKPNGETMLVLTMLLAGLFLAMLQERRDYILYEKIHLTEREFLSLSETFDGESGESIVKTPNRARKRLQHGTTVDVANLYRSVSMCTDRYTIVRRFGHNGLVYYDHQLGHKVSVFMTRDVMNEDDTTILNWLACQALTQRE